MIDYISRQAAIEAVEKCQQYKVSKEDYAVDFAEVKTALMLLPTSDVVEVVRCKDCKHRYYDRERDFYYCRMYYGMGDTSDNNYCSLGERADA